MRLLDLALGPHDALRQSRLWRQKGFGDFRRAETPESPQRQGNLSLPIQGRMTTGEDQAQAIIRKAHSGLVRIGLRTGECPGLDITLFNVVAKRVLLFAPRALPPGG